MSDFPAIYRVIIPISDTAKAVDFYVRLLNMEGRAVGGGRFYFDCGAVILALLECDKPPIPEYIYFEVDDLDAVYQRASELGCLSEGDVHGSSAGEIAERPWGELSFYAQDPFGNGLCFVDTRTVFTGMRV